MSTPSLASSLSSGSCPLRCRCMRMFPIPGDNVFPEGITEGPGTSFFVGSTGDGAIYRGDTSTGIVEPFLPPDGDGRVCICGLDIDQYGRLIACDFGGAQLFVYDLATRALVARRPLPSTDALPNDVVVYGDWAYVTDSKRPVVCSTGSCAIRLSRCCSSARRARAARSGGPVWAPARPGPSILAGMTSTPTGCCSTTTSFTVSPTGALTPAAISAT